MGAPLLSGGTAGRTPAPGEIKRALGREAAWPWGHLDSAAVSAQEQAARPPHSLAQPSSGLAVPGYQIPKRPPAQLPWDGSGHIRTSPSKPGGHLEEEDSTGTAPAGASCLSPHLPGRGHPPPPGALGVRQGPGWSGRARGTVRTEVLPHRQDALCPAAARAPHLPPSPTPVPGTHWAALTLGSGPGG